MKKTLLIALTVVLIISTVSFTGCSSLDEDTSINLKQDTFSIYEDLKKQCKEAKSNDEIFSYLEKFAAAENIFVKKINDSSIILTKPASDNYSSAKTTTLQCSFDISASKKECINGAIALATIKNSNDHGKINLIFTLKNKNEFTGALNLPKEYLKNTNLINLLYYPNTTIFNGSASTASYELNKDVTTKTPSGKKAYTISITGCSGGSSSDRSTKHPNPVAFIGKHLSSIRSSGVILEVSSFNGGNNIEDFPTYAKATVVINENDELKLLKKMDSAKEDFTDKYSEKELEMKYEFKEVSVPSTVFSDDDTSSLLSLMYTLEDGVYATTEEDNEGDVVSISTISKIRTNNKKITVDIMARSLEKKVIKEMNNSFKNISDLSDFKFKITGASTLWPVDEKSNLIDSFSVAANQCDLNAKVEETFAKTESSLFYAKNNNLDIMSLGISIDDAWEISKSLTLYLSTLNNTK